jgi:hypothetical protein
MCGRRLTMPAVGLLLLTVVFRSPNLAVGDENKVTEQEPSVRLQKRAEALLEVLRARQWGKAVPMVITATGKHDEETRRRLDIPKAATAEVTGAKVGAWFQYMYGKVPPGQVKSVQILGPDQDFALVLYRHEDLDGFNMRLVDGEWYYTLESGVAQRRADSEVRSRARAHRDQWIAREKPEAADHLKRGVVDSVKRTKEGWHVTFVTWTGHDKPEGRHDYFLHIYMALDGTLLKVVRGPDRLS